jgi:hypothetical protein
MHVDVTPVRTRAVALRETPAIGQAFRPGNRPSISLATTEYALSFCRPDRVAAIAAEPAPARNRCSARRQALRLRIGVWG